MGKTNLSTVVRNVQSSAKKHSPEILTGLGIAGMITTTVMAVQATPKALDLMAEIKETHLENDDKKAYAKDIITKVAPVYIPSAVIGILSISCIICASSVNVKRNAALATAYSLSESALREYRGKVVETIGEKKEQVVRDAIAKDKIEQNPVSDQTIIVTNKGDTLCYDPISGRYFKSDIDKIQKSVNELNRQMLQTDYVSLNDFYDEIGLGYARIGEDLGWRVDRGMIDLCFSSQLADDGTPCLVLDHRVPPIYDYDK